MQNKGFTLVELIIVTTVVGFVILSFTAMSIFFMRQVNISRERSNMWSQMEYTMDDMRLRCVSAITTTTPLTSGGSIIINATSGNTFSFEGESDIYNVTPDDTSDNAIYTYSVLPDTDANNPESLILQTTNITSGAVATDILIDGKFSPQMEVRHNCPDPLADCDEPHFVTITINLSSIENIELSRSEGIRFWFLDMVQ